MSLKTRPWKSHFGDLTKVIPFHSTLFFVNASAEAAACKWRRHTQAALSQCLKRGWKWGWEAAVLIWAKAALRRLNEVSVSKMKLQHSRSLLSITGNIHVNRLLAQKAKQLKSKVCAEGWEKHREWSYYPHRRDLSNYSLNIWCVLVLDTFM